MLLSGRGKALFHLGRRAASGLSKTGGDVSAEAFARHRSVMNVFEKRPLLAADAFVAPNASVIGEVMLLGQSSVWYGAIVRGDKNRIKIGAQSAVLDRAVLSTVSSLETGFSSEIDIGNCVTVGPGAVLTSCVVGSSTSIGAGAVIGAGSVIESNCVIAAGAVLPAGTMVTQGQFWAGNPATFIRDVSDEEIAYAEKTALNNATLAQEHSDEFLPFGFAYVEAEGVAAQQA